MIEDSSSPSDDEEDDPNAEYASGSEEEEEDESPLIPEQPEDPVNSLNHPLSKWSKTQVWEHRQVSPYLRSTGRVPDDRFKTVFQYNVYHQLMAIKKTRFAPFKQVDVGHLQENAHLYPGVFDALVSLGLIPIVTYSRPFNEDLVMQFYATVFFERDDERSLTWMSGTRMFSAPFRKFSEIIPYQFYSLEHPDFARISELTHSKDEIAFAYKPDETSMPGSAHHLLPLYDTIRHILTYTITPKAGDSHNLRSSMFDLFMMINEGKKVDVLDTMFQEMRECVRLQKSSFMLPSSRP